MQLGFKRRCKPLTGSGRKASRSSHMKHLKKLKDLKFDSNIHLILDVFPPVFQKLYPWPPIRYNITLQHNVNSNLIRVCVCVCLCVCVCVRTSFHREGFICLDRLECRRTDQRCYAEDVSFLCQFPSSLL